MDWHPLRSWRTVRPVLGLALGLFLGEGGLGLWLARQEVSLRAFAGGLAGFLGLLALGAGLWWLWGYWSLRYHLDRNALTICWAGLRETIPLPDLLAVEQGGEEVLAPRFPLPLRTAGYWIGPARTVQGERLRVFATRPPAEQVVLRTRMGTWAISPRDPEAFLKRLEAERRLGPTRRLHPGREWQGLWGWPLWRDRWAWVLGGIGVLGAVAFFGMEAAHPATLGRPPLAAPAVALGFLAVTWAWGGLVHGKARRQAYLLWAGAAWVQWAGAVLAWWVSSR
ncbi:MAG: PH domain-containing protein [Anaerolineae bacterium]